MIQLWQCVLEINHKLWWSVNFLWQIASKLPEGSRHYSLAMYNNCNNHTVMSTDTFKLSEIFQAMHPSMFLADNSLLVRIFTVRIGTQRYTSNFNEDVYTKCVHVNNYFFIHKEGHTSSVDCFQFTHHSTA